MVTLLLVLISAILLFGASAVLGFFRGIVLLVIAAFLIALGYQYPHVRWAFGAIGGIAGLSIIWSLRKRK